MKSTSFLDLAVSGKKIRKREFFEQLEEIVPWAELEELIAPHYYPDYKTGRKP